MWRASRAAAVSRQGDPLVALEGLGAAGVELDGAVLPDADEEERAALGGMRVGDDADAAAAGAGVGGLGEAVAGLLMRSGVTPPFRQIALPDAFLDAGALPTLHDRYGISAEAMAKSISGWL